MILTTQATEILAAAAATLKGYMVAIIITTSTASNLTPIQGSSTIFTIEIAHLMHQPMNPDPIQSKDQITHLMDLEMSRKS